MENNRRVRAKSAAAIEAARQARNRAISAVDRARNLVHAVRLKRQLAILEKAMGTPRVPMRGRCRGSQPVVGGRRRTDPPAPGPRPA